MPLMDIFYAIEIFGTVIFAISGATSAIRRNMGLSGVIFVAFVVGNGGGTVRDLLLGHGPVFWLTDTNSIIASVVPGILMFYLAHFIKLPKWLMLISDAIGLGAFAIAGAQKALAVGMNAEIAIIMGMITGVGGGIIRDLVCQEIPLFMRREIYATAALFGALSYILILHHQLFPKHIAALIGISITIIIRLIALRWNIRFPDFRKTEKA